MNILLSIFLAGSFTIFAPCTVTVSPTSVSGAIGEKSLMRALTVIISAAVSILIFTLLLKSTTTLLFVPDLVWKLASGGTLLFMGLTFIIPSLWQYAAIGKPTIAVVKEQDSFTTMYEKPLEASHPIYNRAEFLRSMMIGGAIGPIFNTCSPTYSFISAAIIPEKFLLGLGILLIFVLGFCLPFGTVNTLCQQISSKFFPASVNPFGLTKKILGGILIIIGIMAIFGFDKDLEAFILEHFLFEAPFNYEQKILENLKEFI